MTGASARGVGRRIKFTSQPPRLGSFGAAIVGGGCERVPGGSGTSALRSGAPRTARQNGVPVARDGDRCTSGRAEPEVLRGAISCERRRSFSPLQGPSHTLSTIAGPHYSEAARLPVTLSECAAGDARSWSRCSSAQVSRLSGTGRAERPSEQELRCQRREVRHGGGFGGSGRIRAERPSEQELRRRRLSGLAGLHVQQFRGERGERRFQRAASGALKSNRAPPGASQRPRNLCPAAPDGTARRTYSVRMIFCASAAR